MFGNYTKIIPLRKDDYLSQPTLTTHILRHPVNSQTLYLIDQFGKVVST